MGATLWVMLSPFYLDLHYNITLRLLKIEYEQQNDPWNVERFLEDLLLVVKGQSNLDIDGYL